MEIKDIEDNVDYWNNFYQSNFKHTPSQFCVCVLTEVPTNAVVVELGSGNGRDALYFASQGHITVAMDLSHQAILSCDKQSEIMQIDHATFIQGDLTEKNDVEKTIQVARTQSKERTIIFYSRFVMHSLDEVQEDKFLQILSQTMQQGEFVYFEFRSQEDACLDKHFGGHYRRYVDSDAFKNKIKNLDYAIHYSHLGQGMAKYKEEDPFVIRIIAKKL
ncbi:MAG: hypothetical protein AB8B80_09625 [Marinicellaceae bacterium]